MKTKTIKMLIYFGAATFIVISAILILNSSPSNEVPLGARSGGETPATSIIYATSTSAVAEYTGAAYIHRVIVGSDIGGQLIRVIDSATSTSIVTDDYVISLESDTLAGSYEIGTEVSDGIWFTASSTDSVSIIYTPK